MQKGIEKGIEEGMQKVAVNALNKGMSVDDIVDLTGLTKEQIVEISEVFNQRANNSSKEKYRNLFIVSYN